MKYLGFVPDKPKVAVFDFTCCEGCELQFVNKEETLPAFLSAVDIVQFREASSQCSDDYQLAFVEGAITRNDEIERLKTIRHQAKILVALGSCACFGGINKLKNTMDPDVVMRTVYGDSPKETAPARSITDIVKVDMEIPGCPVSKAEIERIVQYLIWDIPYKFPVYPVCYECKQQFLTCVFEKGQLCLGSITRGGCNAPCPGGGLGCLGCRGPAEEPNFAEFLQIASKKEFSPEEIKDCLNFFGGFEEVNL